MPDIKIPRWLNTSTNQENNHQLHVFVDGSTVALAAVAYICSQKRTKSLKHLFCLENAKLHQLKKVIVQKLKLEAAVLGTRFCTLIQAETTKLKKSTCGPIVVLSCNGSAQLRNKTFLSRIDSKKLREKLQLMSGILSQLILIQPTKKSVALSHQKSPRNGLQHHKFARH